MPDHYGIPEETDYLSKGFQAETVELQKQLNPESSTIDLVQAEERTALARKLQ